MGRTVTCAWELMPFEVVRTGKGKCADIRSGEGVLVRTVDLLPSKSGRVRAIVEGERRPCGLVRAGKLAGAGCRTDRALVSPLFCGK